MTAFLRQFNAQTVAGPSFGTLASKKTNRITKNEITKKYGEVSGSGAGSLGGEILGMTRKTDKEIGEWNEAWLLCNPKDNVMSESCQKYCIELIICLTDNNYRCEQRLNEALLETGDRKMYAVDGFTRAKARNAIASFGVARIETSAGPASVIATFTEIC